MAGLIGAAGNIGYLLVAVIGLGLSGLVGELASTLDWFGVPPSTVEILTRNQGWRILMILGTTPALLTFLIRLFVPESERWLHEQRSGATNYWATYDLAGVLVGATGPALIVYLWAYPHSTFVRTLGTLLGLAVATAGYTYPVLRYLQRQAEAIGDKHASSWPTLRRLLLAAGLSGVALLGTWGAVQWAPSWADQLTGGQTNAKYYTQMSAAAGAVLGTVLAAILGDLLGRRLTYAFFCVASIVSLLVLYQGNAHYGSGLLISVFFVGLCTASFYGWLPLYLPELFSTRIRATGQDFGFNFGRILAAVGTLQTGSLFAKSIQLGPWTFTGGYPTACSAMSAIYLLGIVLILFAPETRGRGLPD